MREATTTRMFSIHLIEDEKGTVRVFSDWTGEGERAMRIGCEILSHLSDIQPYTEGQLHLAAATVSDAEH
jgi:hypothetical protein